MYHPPRLIICTIRFDSPRCVSPPTGGGDKPCFSESAETTVVVSAGSPSCVEAFLTSSIANGTSNREIGGDKRRGRS